MPQNDVTTVYLAWRDGQPNPGRIHLTPSRVKLIETALLRFTVDDLTTFIRYAYNANTREARWWRGEELSSNGRTYTKLENLFRVMKIVGRVNRAREWADYQASRELEDGVELDPIGHMRTRRTAE